MSIKYFIIRLHMLTLSPIFPSLLTFILLIVYKIYFDTVILCDDGSPPMLLDQLKENLDIEIARNTDFHKDLSEYIKKFDEEKVKPEGLNTDKTAFYQKQIRIRKRILVESLHKTIEIVDSIRKIEPDFSSDYPRINADLLRSLGQDVRR